MTNLIRIENNDGLEFHVDTTTNMAYASISATARMLGVNESTVTSFLSCTDQHMVSPIELWDLAIEFNLDVLASIIQSSPVLKGITRQQAVKYAAKFNNKRNRPKGFQSTKRKQKVYAIGNKASKVVKIGYTSGGVNKRLKALATGCPFELQILGTTTGGPELERKLHDKFQHLRMQGEWFRLDDTILAEFL